MQLVTLKLLQYSSLDGLRNVFACRHCPRLRHLSKFDFRLQNLRRKRKGKKLYVSPYCADCESGQSWVDERVGCNPDNIA